MTTSESATVVVAVSYSGSIGDEELKKDFKFGLLQIEKICVSFKSIRCCYCK